MQPYIPYTSYFNKLTFKQHLLAGLPLLALALFLRRRARTPNRQRKIPPNDEHVLVLGASSGVGRALAILYALRGACVCIVARNEDGLEDARRDCLDAFSERSARKEGEDKVIAIVADFANAEEMMKVRERIQADWGRLDTLAVIAGVSSLRPLLETAGIERGSGAGESGLPDADLKGIQSGQRIAGAAMQANFFGPLTAALTFIPLLSRTSPSPSVLLLSSVGAIAPAPTRSLYTSTKSASLLLYQSLSIEHPSIHFSFILPGTIEGNFRASAVDSGTVREADPNRSGLRREFVAKRCITAIDRQERDVFMQGFYRYVPLVYYALSPRLIEFVARKKYKYP